MATNTTAEQRILDRLASQKRAGTTPGFYVTGAEVCTARRLEARGLIKLIDDGYMRGNPERWSIAPAGPALENRKKS